MSNQGPSTPVKVYDGKILPNYGGTRLNNIRWKPGSGGPKGGPIPLAKAATGYKTKRGSTKATKKHYG